MAIAKELPTLEANIIVDKNALTEFEYDDEEQAPNTITKYIESSSGAEFAMRCKLSPPWPDHSLKLVFLVDGKVMRTGHMFSKDFKGASCKNTASSKQYCENDIWYIQKFCFSELKIDDSGAAADTDLMVNSLKGVGEITIRVFRIGNLREVVVSSTPQSNTPQSRKPADVEFGNVPEKALKGQAISHRTGLGPPVALRAEVSRPASFTRIDYDYLDGRKSPAATFIFKYRSRAALQSLLVIPRSSSPVPLEERDVATLTTEESRKLIQRMREREATAKSFKQEKIKRERSGEEGSLGSGDLADDNDEISMISSRPKRRRRHPTTIDANGVETIDLT
ncbi:hypothetical protein NX059_009068 [Plenodomus lindquistii]|nr:hypothetical protein NX059_009068 [Plenodomus lindquistii]